MVQESSRVDAFSQVRHTRPDESWGLGRTFLKAKAER